MKAHTPIRSSLSLRTIRLSPRLMQTAERFMEFRLLLSLGLGTKCTSTSRKNKKADSPDYLNRRGQGNFFKFLICSYLNALNWNLCYYILSNLDTSPLSLEKLLFASCCIVVI
eukprot:scaffold18051_cov54-Cylindrotheca_fusiformis.AAC.1